MAIYNGRILMRKGLEADFDASKLMSGEWALSTDKGIIRICLEAGTVIRMATYEAFEEDMKQIEEILLECKSVEEAVQRINTEINAKVEVVVEYVGQAKAYSEQAKKYRDEAEVLRNEAEQFAPEGYAELKEQVQENTFKVDTIIEKADLGIKETASGEEIHLTDSAEGKAVEFALLGKARQNTTSGKNLLEFPYLHTNKTENGITWTVNSDGSVTCNGTATATSYFRLQEKDYGEENVVVAQDEKTVNGYTFSNGRAGGQDIYLSYDKSNKITFLRIGAGITVNNLTFYPMIRLASITDDTWEKPTNGASPNPSYPQEIEVSGESYNLLENTATSQTINGVEFVVNEDKSVTVSGTASVGTWLKVGSVLLPNGNYILSGCPSGGSYGKYAIGTNDKGTDFGSGVNITLDAPKVVEISIGIYSDQTVANLTFYPMIRKASVKNNRYMPYGKGSVEVISSNGDNTKTTTAIIPTPNGLAGIKVSSGGNYTDQNGQQWICDEIVKYADGSGALIRRIGKEVFDGSEDEGWATQETVDNEKYRVRTKILSGLIKAPSSNSITFVGLATIEKSVPASAGGTYNCVNGISVNALGSELHVYSDSYNTSNIALWTDYLSENPMTLYYELAEPITTPLTAEEIAEIEKLHTFYPVTNISNDFDCGMKVKYNCDSKNYIDNKIALLTTAMVNNI